MAKPRVFISSTYYDLKHLRSAFETFLEQFGFEFFLRKEISHTHRINHLMSRAIER